MRETGNQIIKLFLAFLVKDCRTEAMPCLFDQATATQAPGAHCFMCAFSRAVLLPPLYGKMDSHKESCYYGGNDLA